MKSDDKEKEMETAYKLGSKLVKDRLEMEDKENIEILEELDDNDTICITGTYDHIHLVLRHSGIPFKEISADQLGQVKLRPDMTVFVNCASSFPEDKARMLSEFVFSGGQLITTDWALQNVLEVAFPRTIRYNKKPTGDEVVRIEVLDRDDPIIKGFLDEETMPVWWLEGSSYPCEIIDKDRVKVLIKSKELGERYGEEAVVVKFPHGEGTVIHMISHFYLQRTETREAKQQQKSSSYSAMKGASVATQEMFEAAEAVEDINYGMVQSATSSAEFVNRALLEQKKKFGKKSKKK
ncbi:MAG: hypothetical protein INQ03_13410 [Candidatus Heimdallarchaeota archaeon]|nr:hypothetical protein [Candidatus Heimdallarchaeota archaeon]